MALVYQDISSDGAGKSLPVLQIKALHFFALPPKHIFCTERAIFMDDGNAIPD